MTLANSRIVLALGMIAAAAVASATPAISPIGGTEFTNNQWSLGYEFAVTGPGAYVTALGFFDSGLDGLTESHDVAIYDMSGNVLMSSTVAKGTSDMLLGRYRYSRSLLGNVLLAPGHYVIAAATGSENYLFSPSSLNVGTGISYVGDRFTQSSSLVFPTSSTGDMGWFAPNFTYEVQAVPEPASMAALGLGALGLLRRRRKA